MSLSTESEWVLVACGLIAHADGVLDSEECDRLLAMLDDELDPDDYSDWMARIGDRAALQDRLANLDDPPPERVRAILEQAWQMALVDGDRCEAELVALREIASRLEIPDEQLDFWREAWTSHERTFSTRAVQAAAAVLGQGQAIADDDRELVEQLASVLPTTHEHREELLGGLEGGVDIDDLARELAALSRRDRQRLMLLIAPLVFESTDLDATTAAFHALAGGAGLSEIDRAELLRRARG